MAKWPPACYHTGHNSLFHEISTSWRECSLPTFCPKWRCYMVMYQGGADLRLGPKSFPWHIGNHYEALITLCDITLSNGYPFERVISQRVIRASLFILFFLNDTKYAIRCKYLINISKPIIFWSPCSILWLLKSCYFAICRHTLKLFCNALITKLNQKFQMYHLKNMWKMFLLQNIFNGVQNYWLFTLRKWHGYHYRIITCVCLCMTVHMRMHICINTLILQWSSILIYALRKLETKWTVDQLDNMSNVAVVTLFLWECFVVIVVVIVIVIIFLIPLFLHDAPCLIRIAPC